MALRERGYPRREDKWDWLLAVRAVQYSIIACTVCGAPEMRDNSAKSVECGVDVGRSGSL